MALIQTNNPKARSRTASKKPDKKPKNKRSSKAQPKKHTAKSTQSGMSRSKAKTSSQSSTTPKPKTNRPSPIQKTPQTIEKKGVFTGDGSTLRARIVLSRMTKTRVDLPQSVLIFGEEAFNKLIWFRDRGGTEVGAMCETKADDPLYVIDLHFIKQECSSAYTEFDEEAQQDYLVDMTERGVHPNNFMRIWVHTHPGQSATPIGS
jgi:DNA mismatch repair ATPase MutL